MDYSPWDLKESDMTEQLTLFHKVLLNFAQVKPLSRSFQYSLLLLLSHFSRVRLCVTP